MVGLDVHVLTMPNTRTEWVAQRRASIAAAVDAAGFQVVVHELDGEPGHIGRGRARGYELGAQPYVTYVDCDDYLLQSAFSALAEALSAGHDAIAPGETTEQNGVRRRVPGPHHLICYRRGIATVFAHGTWAVCGDLALAKITDIHCVADYSYVHRLYESPGRIMRRSYQSELTRAHRG